MDRKKATELITTAGEKRGGGGGERKIRKGWKQDETKAVEGDICAQDCVSTTM